MLCVRGESCATIRDRRGSSVRKNFGESSETGKGGNASGAENGREHEVLLDRRCGVFASEARSRHPTCKESHDAASETRCPQVRIGDSEQLTI